MVRKKEKKFHGLFIATYAGCIWSKGVQNADKKATRLIITVHSRYSAHLETYELLEVGGVTVSALSRVYCIRDEGEGNTSDNMNNYCSSSSSSSSSGGSGGGTGGGSGGSGGGSSGGSGRGSGASSSAYNGDDDGDRGSGNSDRGSNPRMTVPASRVDAKVLVSENSVSVSQTKSDDEVVGTAINDRCSPRQVGRREVTSANTGRTSNATPLVSSRRTHGMSITGSSSMMPAPPASFNASDDSSILSTSQYPTTRNDVGAYQETGRRTLLTLVEVCRFSSFLPVSRRILASSVSKRNLG
jgi:hypothetical protein